MIFKSGTVIAHPFKANMGEISAPPAPKKRRSHAAIQSAIEEARSKAIAEGIEEGRATGHAAGYQAGFDQAHAEASTAQAELLREFATELQNVHARMEHAVAEWFRASERELEAMAVQIAERLLDVQLGLDRTIVTEMVGKSLAQIAEGQRIRIRVNPFDSMILGNAREELLAACASLRSIEIVDDSSIIAGCVIETERGVIDATVATRLEVLKGGLEEAA